MTHSHWEFTSVCPHCGKVNRGKCPVGEKLVLVHCEHCTHSYDYVHVIEHPEVVEEGDESEG